MLFITVILNKLLVNSYNLFFFLYNLIVNLLAIIFFLKLRKLDLKYLRTQFRMKMSWGVFLSDKTILFGRVLLMIYMEYRKQSVFMITCIKPLKRRKYFHSWPMYLKKKRHSASVCSYFHLIPFSYEDNLIYIFYIPTRILNVRLIFNYYL